MTLESIRKNGRWFSIIGDQMDKEQFKNEAESNEAAFIQKVIGQVKAANETVTGIVIWVDSPGKDIIEVIRGMIICKWTSWTVTQVRLQELGEALAALGFDEHQVMWLTDRIDDLFIVSDSGEVALLIRPALKEG